MPAKYVTVATGLEPWQHQWCKELVQEVDGLSVSDVIRYAIRQLSDWYPLTRRGELLETLILQARADVYRIPSRRHAGLPVVIKAGEQSQGDA